MGDASNQYNTNNYNQITSSYYGQVDLITLTFVPNLPSPGDNFTIPFQLAKIGAMVVIRKEAGVAPSGPVGVPTFALFTSTTNLPQKYRPTQQTTGCLFWLNTPVAAARVAMAFVINTAGTVTLFQVSNSGLVAAGIQSIFADTACYSVI